MAKIDIVVATDGSTIDINGSGQLEVKAGGIGASQIANGAVDGTTLQGGGGTALGLKTGTPAQRLSAYPLVPGTDITNMLKTVVSSPETELTGTTATVIATYTPAANGQFLVLVKFTVKTAATTVTATITYKSINGAASETITLLNAQSLDVEDHMEIPVLVGAASGTAIDVNVTAGTANQVYCSAAIMQLV